MSKSAFDEFVRRQQIEQKETEAAFDPAQQLAEWLNYLELLYKQITDYLQNYIENGLAQIEYEDISINEEFSGVYTARQMLLKIGRSTVRFTPIGTMLIGMKGRVDVQGPSGRATLFLLNKQATSARSLIRVTIGGPPPPTPSAEAIRQIEWVWKIGTKPPEMRFIDLTQEAFFDMILEVANA